MDQGVDPNRVFSGPPFVAAMKANGVAAILDAGAARPAPELMSGSWWQKTEAQIASGFTAPLDPWPGLDGDLSWALSPGAAQGAKPPSREFLAYQYFMHRRINRMMEFRRRWCDPADDGVPAHVLRHGEVVRTEGATLRVEHGPVDPRRGGGCQGAEGREG